MSMPVSIIATLTLASAGFLFSDRKLLTRETLSKNWAAALALDEI